MAQPVGGQVISGLATITTPNVRSTLITQSSAKAIIDWQQFSLANGQSVQFAQPGSSSITLNRVTGGGLSSIAGSITANGQVWLINPNGVLFGSGASVNVSGLLATTSDIANNDFLSGNYVFGGAPSGSAVINKGVINAGTGGSVVLSAPRVVNKGVITAHAGHVVLGGASAFTVDFDGDHLLSYQVKTAPAGDTADAGGQVLMTRRAAHQVQRDVVNDKGMTEATHARVENGEVILDGGDGVTNSGTVDVSARIAGQTGGTVEIEGKSVAITDGARIDASGDAGGGTVLIGGSFHGAGPQLNSQATTVGKAIITADAVSSGNGGNVAVWSDGKTRVAAAISAKGGAKSGNGGHVETSGHTLQVNDATTVTTTAANGVAGNWLLDPGTINISSTSPDTTLDGSNNYTLADDASTSDTKTIDPSTIVTALNSSNVTLEASSQINVRSSIIYTSGSDLLLLSKGSITIGNGGIQNSGAGSIVLVAGWDGSSLPTALAAANTYGLSTSGIIQLQGSAAAVGSASGAVYFSAYGLSLQDNGGAGYAQVGYHGAGGGDIYIQTLSGTSSLTTYGIYLNESYGGTTQIGNGGYDGTITGAATGNITIVTTGDTTVSTYSGTAKIGNYGDTHGASGTVSLTTKTLTNGGATVGYDSNVFITDNIGTNAGTGGDISLTLTSLATADIALTYDSPHNVTVNAAGDFRISTTGYNGTGNLTFATPNSIDVNGAMTSSGTNRLSLLAGGSINAAAGIQNSGAGDIVIVQGWDGTSHPTGLAAAGTYGLSNNNISLNGANVAVGSASGNTYLSGWGLLLAENSNTTYAQVGYHGAGGGNISIETTGGNINLSEGFGGAGTTQIGNGGYGGVAGAITGNISITAVGSAVPSTGIITVTNDGGNSAIGNHGTSESGAVAITTGDLASAGTGATYTVNTLITGNIGTSVGTGGDVSLTLTAAAGATTINALSYASPHNVSLATSDGFTFAGAIANTGTGSLSLTSASTLSDTGTIALGGALSATVTNNSSTISLGNIGNAVSGAVLLNTALGDASFNNSIATTLGAPVADDSIPGLYNFVINGNLTVKVAGGSTPTLTLNGRLHVKGTGDTTLEANGDLINNNGNGTILADHLNLISDAGGIGTGSWTFGDGSQSGGTLNLFLSANNGAGTVQINPGDVSFGGTALATTQGYGALAGSLLVFGNGLVTQDTGTASGILRINTSLDVHAAADVTLTNTLNAVHGTDYFRTPGAISFTNSVSTIIGRANGGGLDTNNNPNLASTVTITVQDGVGATNPTLTLGNSTDLAGSVPHLTSIDSNGRVTLTADGAISDGYASVTSAGNAGHITAAVLSVTSSTAGISLLNPVNNVTYDGVNPVSLIAGNGPGVGFVNSQGVLVQVSTNTGNFNITTTDTNSTVGHSVIEIFQANAPDTSAGPSLLHASGNIYNEFSPGPGLQAKSLALVSDNGAIGSSGSPITLSAVTSGTAQVVQADAAGDVYLKSFQGFTISNLGFTSGGNPIGTHGITSGGTVSIQINTSGNNVDVSQAGDSAITAASLTVNDQDTSASSVTLDNTANAITGLVQLTGQQSVTLVNSVSTLVGTSSAQGMLKIVSSGDITINTAATLSSNAPGDGAITLAATGNFINSSGSGALSEPNGAFRIYSSNPANDTFGSLDSGNTAVWNTASGASITPTGNRYIFAFQPTLTFTSTDLTKVYGDTPSVASSYTVSGYQAAVTGAYLGDSAANVFSGTPGVSSSGTSATATVTGSPYVIAVDITGLTALNRYALATANTGHLTVSQKALSVTALPQSKTYGDTLVLNSTAFSVGSGLINGDTVTGVSLASSGTVAGAAAGPYAITPSSATGSGVGNYAITYNTGTLTVAKALLSYVTDTASRTYGAANPVLTGTVTGFVNGENQSGATTGTLAFSSPATATTGVGQTAIIGSGLSAANYAFTQAGGNSTALTINPATLSYVANAASKTYGDANPGFSGTVVGFVNSETQSGATTGTLLFDSTATSGSGVGSYAINGSGLTASNYTFTQKASNSTALTINPATLSYVADTASRTYGAANPFLTGTVTGFVNGDIQSSATTGTLAFNSPATATTGVGQAAVNGFGLAAGNYVFVQAAGNSTALTINPATLSYVADAASKTYGAANPVFTGTVTGFQNGETQSSATTGTLAFSSSATSASGVGLYAINGSGLTASNYIFAQASGNSTALTINRATLSYVATTASKTYGAFNPTFGGTVTGFVNGDTQSSSTTGTLLFSSSANTSSGVGHYAINGSGLSASNYNFIQAAGNSTSLTVNPATLTYVANSAARTYGAANPAFGGTVTGFVNGDTQSSATTGTLVFGSSATTGSSVGSYAINGSGLGAGNYIFVQAPGNSTALTINRATLTYVATTASKIYGRANPAFGGTVTGFVNGDTQSSATTGTLAFTSLATVNSGAGLYAINGSGLGASNYTFIQAASNGTAFTISRATLSYVANAATRIYGGANPFLTGSVTGFVNGDTQSSATTGSLAFSSPATTSSSVGNYAVNGFGLGASNYVFVQAAGNSTALTVNPATLTYAANSATRTYGAANPAFSGTVTGFVNGDTQSSATTGTLAFTSLATIGSNIGRYAIDGSGLSANNYVFVQKTSNTTALTVNPAPLVYIADAVSQTYGAATSALTGTVGGFVNGDTQSSATTGTLVFNTSATGASGVGSYAITGSGLSARNYVLLQSSFNATALTINPATLVYTADAAGMTYGAAMPALSGKIAGFVNGDTQSSATTGTLVFGTSATSASGAGSYAVNGSGLTASNYIFVQAAGNSAALSINPATLSYVASIATRTYGADNPLLSGTVTGFVNGDTQSSATTGTLAFGSPATAATGVGQAAVNGFGLSAKNYVFVQAGGNSTALTINPATLSYVANAASKAYGAANPTFSGTVTGFVNGDTQSGATTGTLTFTSQAGSASPVGGYAINGAGLSAVNYNFVQASTNSAALKITPAILTAALTGTVTKSYDGTTTATLSAANYAPLSGILFGDAVSLASLPTTGSFGNAATGTGKVVTVSGLSLAGAGAANYVLASSVVSAPIGVITASVSATDPGLLSVVVSSPQTGVPSYLSFVPAVTIVTEAGVLGAPLLPSLQAVQVAPPTVSNPIAALTASNAGTQTQTPEPPTPADTATNYVIDSMNGSTVSASKVNVIIPGILNAVSGQPKPPPPSTGENLSAWGNPSLWQ